MSTYVTVKPELGTAIFTIDDAGLSLSGSLAIDDVNGHRVVPIPPDSETPYQYIDRQIPLFGTVIYTIWVNGSYTSRIVDSSQVEWGTQVWLSTPLADETLNVKPEMITGYRVSVPTRTRVNPIMDRADPIPKLGTLGTRQGVITYWAASYEDVVAIRNLYSEGQIVLLRQIPHVGLDMYHVLGEGDITEENYQLRPGLPTRWSVGVPVVEVPTP